MKRHALAAAFFLAGGLCFVVGQALSEDSVSFPFICSYTGQCGRGLSIDGGAIVNGAVSGTVGVAGGDAGLDFALTQSLTDPALNAFAYRFYNGPPDGGPIFTLGPEGQVNLQVIYGGPQAAQGYAPEWPAIDVQPLPDGGVQDAGISLYGDCAAGGTWCANVFIGSLGVTQTAGWSILGYPGTIPGSYVGSSNSAPVWGVTYNGMFLGSGLDAGNTGTIWTGNQVVMGSVLPMWLEYAIANPGGLVLTDVIGNDSNGNLIFKVGSGDWEFWTDGGVQTAGIGNNGTIYVSNVDAGLTGTIWSGNQVVLGTTLPLRMEYAISNPAGIVVDAFGNDANGNFIFKLGSGDLEVWADGGARVASIDSKGNIYSDAGLWFTSYDESIFAMDGGGVTINGYCQSSNSPDPCRGALTVENPLNSIGDLIRGYTGPSNVITVKSTGEIITSGDVCYVNGSGGTQCLSDAGAGGGGGGAVWDAGYLAYSYAGPLPVDNSSQTSCTTSQVYCGLSSTSLGTCAGCKVQNVENQGTNPICIATVAGVSCPSAIDAGTTVGQMLFGGGFYTFNTDQTLYCVMATGPQVSPDAGTTVISCK